MTTKKPPDAVVAMLLELLQGYARCKTTEVIYISDKYAKTDSVIASKRMMDHAGVKYHQLDTGLKEITVSFRIENI